MRNPPEKRCETECLQQVLNDGGWSLDYVLSYIRVRTRLAVFHRRSVDAQVFAASSERMIAHKATVHRTTKKSDAAPIKTMSWAADVVSLIAAVSSEVFNHEDSTWTA